MQKEFYQLADHITSLLTDGEVFTCRFSGEVSDFVRFNKSAIRQAGRVNQRYIGIDLIKDTRHAAAVIGLSGEGETDRVRVSDLVKRLRDRIPHLPEDPHLLYATDVRSGEHQQENRLPEPGAAVDAILEAGRGRDLVGIYAAGPIHAGFANSFGQRNWYTSHSFNLDWTFYHEADKAVKAAYAGVEWDGTEFGRKVAQAAEQLEVLGRPARTIPPGNYRVFLAPSAMYELLGTLCWGGFGLKDHRTKQTTLLKMIEADARMHPSVGIYENTGDGVTPNFQEQGFIKPDRVTLVEDGEFKNCLISPRSAKEYGVPTNGASQWEFPESIELGAGDIPMADVAKRLETGVYINNLWYLNYSDRAACRMTGMTRFATFWVENGVISESVNVMRFDETIYRVLGENLVGLTAEREFILEAGTYEERSTGSARLPGALVEDFAFTL